MEAQPSDFDNKQIKAVFLSPPWGGVGYTQMEKYKFEYMHPNFNDTLTKSLEFSPNLILYIPRNTDVKEICSVLSVYAGKISDAKRTREVVFEIERLGHQPGATSVLAVYTSELSKIQNHEICDHLCDNYLNLPKDEDEAVKCMVDIIALLDLKGASLFTDDVFIRKGQVKISAEDVLTKKIKQLKHHEKAEFAEIKKKYLKDDSCENPEEETKMMDEETKGGQSRKWWVKSSDT